MLGWIFSPIGKIVGGGLIAAVVAGALMLWHKSEYVSRAELDQWKQYSADLAAVYAKREIIVEKYKQEKEEAEQVISAMEDELDEFLKRESMGDDPVVLGGDDIERLRDFLKKHR